MPPKRNDIPSHLRNLQQEEALYIKSIFGVYDYRATGLIPRHCVGKILDKIGVEASILSLPQQMSLREVLLFIDSKIPNQSKGLEASLYSFTRIAGTVQENGGRCIKPEKFVEFMASLDRNVPSVDEVRLLFSTLLDFDDVEGEKEGIQVTTLSRELISFSKKVNTRDMASAMMASK